MTGRSRVSLVGVLALLLAVTGCARADTTSTVATGGHRPSVVRGAAAPAAPVRRTCRAAQLRLVVARSGSVMSQPFADLEIRDTAATPCLLRGYPAIAAWGHHGWTRRPGTQLVRLGLVLHHGLYERRDPGPHPVVVGPHHPGLFSIGTATAYQGGLHPIMIDRLVVVLPGVRTPLRVHLSLVATRPSGARIPVGVTAVCPSR